MATAAHVTTILQAISIRQIQILGVAERMCGICWRISILAFTEAIRRHCNNGSAVYLKPVENPPIEWVLLQANVRLYPDSDDEDDDVYVEIRIHNRRVFVQVIDAHPHLSGPRLPR